MRVSFPGFEWSLGLCRSAMRSLSRERVTCTSTLTSDVSSELFLRHLGLFPLAIWMGERRA